MDNSTTTPVTADSVVTDNKPVPGFDFLDGIANILFAPGRAILGQANGGAVTMKELPIVMLVSAATWYGVYWLITSPSSPFKSEEKAKPIKRVFVKRKKEEDEEEDED